MKSILLIIVTLAFVSCLPKEEAQAPASNPQSSRWNLGATPFPLQMNISTDFNSGESSEIKSASSNWDSSVGGGINFMDDSNTTSPKGSNLNSYQDSTMGIYKLTNWPAELPSSALAVTQLFGTRKNIGSSSEYIEIAHADILVNYDNFHFSGDYDLQTVVLHEMGHFLGLFHENSSRDQSVMYPSISRFTNNRIPKANDVTKLKGLYGISGGAVAAAMAMATVDASEMDLEATTEAVVVLFELRADGAETITVRNQKTNKIISQSHDTAGCEHSK